MGLEPVAPIPVVRKSRKDNLSVRAMPPERDDSIQRLANALLEDSTLESDVGKAGGAASECGRAESAIVGSTLVAKRPTKLEAAPLRNQALEICSKDLDGGKPKNDHRRASPEAKKFPPRRSVRRAVEAREQSKPALCSAAALAGKL